MRKILTMVVALSLSSCMVGPDYYRPCLDIPETYHYEVSDAQNTINTPWWKQFDDPLIEQLIQEALENNKNLKIATANIETAAGILMSTRSQLFPQIGYSASEFRQRLSQLTATPLSPLVPNPQTLFQALGTASWEIDLWGRIRRQTEAATANLLATVEARRGVVLTLITSVVNNYLILRGLDEQLLISKRTLDAYEGSVKFFTVQFEYGQVSQMNVAQAQTQYETAAVTIPQIESQIAQVENALSVLLGKNPGSIPRGKSIYKLILPPVPAGIPSEILEQRPDVMQAEQNLIAANAQIGAARALYFPALSLTGAYGGASQELKNLFKGPAKTWNFAGNIVGPIFTFGNIAGQVMQAEGSDLAALYGYEAAVQNAFADVETALVSHTMLIEQIAAQERLVNASRDYENLAQLQFDGGYSPYSTVLQAQQQLFPAELAWVQIRVLLFNSLVKIYQAMGGGWVVIENGCEEDVFSSDCNLSL